MSDFGDQIKVLETKLADLPEDILSEKMQVLESLKKKESDIEKMLEAIQETSEPESISPPEGIIRLKALEHLKSIVDSLNSEFTYLCDNVEKMYILPDSANPVVQEGDSEADRVE